jgi:uracil-DNA glycosylase family 4
MSTEIIKPSGRRCGKRTRMLDELWAEMAKEPAWSELRASATQFVPGKGPLRPFVMLVGEAPGRHEDQAGEPFVGASGRELDMLLKLAELRREHCYITNIVKFKPRGNRTPTPAEIEAGMSWLRNEITLVDPDVIITLGAAPLAGFKPGERITQIHGQRMTWDHRWFVPMYHPAAGLRNGAVRHETMQDFENITGCQDWG